ncbi:helix-turn-helix domain-containing protein [Carboxylicivirga linearis]|uniref:Helix-turn-helix domain-containing protein n=1 Tax=Carboxylicivirga linearis TaxID=1628157 RepID=A0ABS5K3P7_9BACT|nr:helix-turn-helix domain-containing protein [Carboxylicivirga linearis]MBS2100991.1 helix-turn-helix domain-containing protein [Carboxylicivirga linearis]
MSNTVVVVDDYLFNKLMRKIDQINDKIDSISIEKNDGFKDRWYVTEEVCKLLNVSRRTLQTMRDNKVIAFKKTGRKIYYKASDIEAYLESING